MLPTLTQTEYWLLDANITHRLPLCLVATPGDVVGHINRHWHGMERDELVATLVKLFKQGLAGYKYAFHKSLVMNQFKNKQSRVF